MTFLEFSQIIFNLTVSLFALIAIVFVAILGATLIRIAKKIEQGLEAFKKGSSEIRDKVNNFFNEISLVSLASKVNSWFNKKKKKI